MSFLMRNLRRKTTNQTMNRKVGVVSAVLLDVRAYGFSSAVSALLRDLRD